MDEWKPIETAPKDGTYVLAYDDASQWPEEVEETMWIVQWDRNGWRIALDGQFTNATHWMPLPSPPQT